MSIQPNITIEIVPHKAKVVVIGRGEMSPRQVELLKKALGRDFEVVKQIEQVNTPRDISEAVLETGADAVFSFVLHPTVIHSLSTARRFVKFDYYVPATEAIWTKNFNSVEEGEKACYESGGDVVVNKVVNGNISVRCVKTVNLMKNPVLKIEAEETIS